MRKQILLALGFAASVSAPLVAQSLRPVPEYFAEAIFASSMAASLAELCGAVQLDAQTISARRDALLERLAQDGFDPQNAMAQMQDPTGQVHALQSAFLEKYPLESATQAQVCTAAISEIGNETLIGSLLSEVPYEQ